jgi:hypothetical protein
MTEDHSKSAPRSTPGATKSAKRLGFSSHGRTVSYDDLHKLGLSRAVDEYHKLLKCKSQWSGKACVTEPCCYVALLKFVFLRPLPNFLSPDTLLKTFGDMWMYMSKAISLFSLILIPMCVSFVLNPIHPADPVGAPGSLLAAVLYLPWRIFISACMILLIHCSNSTTTRLKLLRQNGSNDSIGLCLKASFGPAICISEKRTNVEILLGNKQDMEITKEVELCRKVEKLISRYGYHGENKEDVSVPDLTTAVQWIGRLSDDIEDHRFINKEMSVDEALGALEELSSVIGIHVD